MHADMDGPSAGAWEPGFHHRVHRGAPDPASSPNHHGSGHRPFGGPPRGAPGVRPSDPYRPDPQDIRDGGDRMVDLQDSEPSQARGGRRSPHDPQHIGAARGHRGRGPRRTHRTDERILDDVAVRLTDSDAVDAWDIDIGCASGTVTLSGTTPDRRMKYRAEDIVAAIPGVERVENRIGLAESHRDPR